MKNNICAIYSRYSNIDKKTDGDEFRSITNQLRILSEYADSQGFIIYNKYFDHHVSGQTFDRAGFNQMMEDAKAHKFNIIIVKDLSRLGRNYIEAGRYISNIFPDLGIRFIALNDNYDSDINDDITEISFKNILNHLYVKDIGKKIRRTFNIKLHKDILCNTHYGYQINKGKATIYESEAKIVKRIFDEAISDKPLVQIYLDLNKENIPTPGISLYIKTHTEDKIKNIKRNKWILDQIKDILQDEFYTGVTVNAKRAVKSTDETNIKIENTHEPLVTKEVFQEIQNKYFSGINYNLMKGRLKRMIYCKKCLARNGLKKEKASISLVESDDKLYYVDHDCRVRYPYDLFNKRMYDELLDKYHYISRNKEEYINECLIDLSSVDGKALEYYKIKQNCQKEFSNIFESYINGEISEVSYKDKISTLKTNIEKCDKYINNFNIDEATKVLVTNKVNKFINSFYESDDKINTIREFVHLVLYEPRNGKLDLVLKFEEQLGLNRVKLENLVIPEKIRRKDFNLDEITMSILKEHPYIKIKEILCYAREIWEGFTYEMIKKNILKLQRLGKVETEDTHNKNADGYYLKGTPDDFDYKGLKLNRLLKECYKFLYNNPKSSYEDIAEHFNVSQSQAREYVLALRNANAFDDPRFDKNYIPHGSTFSIYTGRKGLDKTIEDKVEDYYLKNPNISRYKLSKLFGITEGNARRIIEKVKKERSETNA